MRGNKTKRQQKWKQKALRLEGLGHRMQDDYLIANSANISCEGAKK